MCKMGIRKKLPWILGAVVALGGLALFKFHDFVDSQRKLTAQEYVEKNLGRIMRDQERRVGLAHLGVPNIIFNETRIGSDRYSPENDSIYLYEGLTVHPEPRCPFLDFMGLGTPPSESNVQDTLEHELGHFYVDQLSERMGNGSWPKSEEELKGSFANVHNAASSIVGEGIAEYFERENNEKPDDFEDSEWPTEEGKDLFDFHVGRVAYDGGYHLVKPIIDKYGVRGVKYLMTNLPTREDLFALPEYRDRTLANLGAAAAN